MPSTFPSRIEQIEGERYASSRARKLFKTSEFCVFLINLTKTLQGWHIKESSIVELNAAKSWKRKFNNVKLLFSQFLRNLYLPFVIFWKKTEKEEVMMLLLDVCWNGYYLDEGDGVDELSLSAIWDSCPFWT